MSRLLIPWRVAASCVDNNLLKTRAREHQCTSRAFLRARYAHSHAMPQLRITQKLRHRLEEVAPDGALAKPRRTGCAPLLKIIFIPTRCGRGWYLTCNRVHFVAATHEKRRLERERLFKKDLYTPPPSKSRRFCVLQRRLRGPLGGFAVFGSADEVRSETAVAMRQR